MLKTVDALAKIPEVETTQKSVSNVDETVECQSCRKFLMQGVVEVENFEKVLSNEGSNFSKKTPKTLKIVEREDDKIPLDAGKLLVSFLLLKFSCSYFPIFQFITEKRLKFSFLWARNQNLFKSLFKLWTESIDDTF